MKSAMRRRAHDLSARSHASTANGEEVAFFKRVAALRRTLDATRNGARKRRIGPGLRAAILQLDAARGTVDRTSFLSALDLSWSVVSRWPEWSRSVRGPYKPRAAAGNGRAVAVIASDAKRRVAPVDVIVSASTATPAAAWSNGDGGALVLTTPSGLVVSNATVPEIVALVRALEGRTA